MRGSGKVRAVDDGREDSCFGFSIQGTYILLRSTSSTSQESKEVRPGTNANMNQGRKRSLPSPAKAVPSSADANAAPLLAGYISGSLSLIAGYPLDSLRVWSQSDGHQQQARMSITSRSAPSNSQCITTRQAIGCPLNRAHLVRPDMAQSAARRIALRAASSSTICTAATSRTLATRATFPFASIPSVKSLYRGIAGPLASVGCVQAIGFATYDQTRRKIRTAASGNSSSADDHHEYSLRDVAIAAFASGSVVSVITAPLIAIKIRQQLSGGGFWHIVRDSYRQGRNGGGIRSLYNGFSAHFALESLGRALFFTCYEGIKREMQCFDAVGDDDSTCSRSACANANLSLGQRMAAAGASGIMSTTILLPVDAVRTRVNSSQASPVGTTGITVSQAACELWHVGGARAFFRGYWASLIRAGPVSALSLPAYELALEWLNSN